MGQCYRDLVVWKKSVDLASSIYDITNAFPREEVYGLTSQLRRAAVSVPSNIAEGQGRQMPGEFKQFLRHSRGSLMEIETQLIIAKRLGYLSADICESLLAEASQIGRMLNGLIASMDRVDR